MIESFKWSYACTDLIGDPEFSTKVHANDISYKKCIKTLKPEMRMVNEVEAKIQFKKIINIINEE